jgi:hypothetical protein
MIFNDLIRRRLLGSIEANNLVLLCGAGLSIPAPSGLMSAVQVARTCYDKYQPIMALPAGMRDNVEQVAEHFYNNGEFESVFLGNLSAEESTTRRPWVTRPSTFDDRILGYFQPRLQAARS